MSLAVHEQGRLRPAAILDILPDECALTFGIAPCTASLTSGPGFQCHNTFDTCQDTTNYDPTGGGVVRFANDVAHQLPISTIRGLESWVPLSSGIDQRRGLGGIGQITFTFRDFPDPTDHLDPYRDRRPVATGAASFWRKFRARNRFYQNRQVLLQTGFAEPDGTYNLATFRPQRYVLEDISLEGPQVVVVCKDVLQLTQRLKLPEATDGRLLNAIDAAQGTIVLRDGDGPQYDALFGAPSTAAPIYLRIDNEIMAAVSRVGDTFQVVRAQTVLPDPTGTLPATHKAGAKVQIVYHKDRVRVDTIILDLLNRCGIPNSLIDLDSFTTEADRWLGTYLFRLFLSKATSVEQLIRELLQACDSYVWWNAEKQAVQFRHVRPRTPDEVAISIDGRKQFVKDSRRVRDLNDRRITRASYFFGLRDWSADFRNKEKRDDLYEQAEVNIDLTAESPNAYGDQVEEEVLAYMVPAELQVEMATLAARRVSRNANPPRALEVKAVAREAYEQEPGAFRDITVPEIVDANGIEVETQFFLKSKKQVAAPGITYRLEYESTQLDERWMFYNEDAGVPRYDLATEEQRLLGFYADANCELIDADGFADPPYLYI